MSTPEDATPTPPVAPPAPLPAIDREQRRLLFAVFFFAAFVLLVWQLLRVLSPFAGSLLGAILIAVVFHPLQRRLGVLGVRAAFAATLTTVVALVTIVVPFMLIGWMLLREAADVVPAVRAWLVEGPDLAEYLRALELPEPFGGAFNAVRDLLAQWAVDLRTMVVDSLPALGSAITGFGAATVRRLLFVLLDLVVLVLALFFFLRDGEQTLRWLVELVPMEREHKQLVMTRVQQTLSAMVRGTFITASVQGGLTGVGLFVAGVPFPVLLAVAAALLAVVPFVGAGLVWIPAAIYLFATSSVAVAVGFTLWGALVVGLVDNVLRPYVVGESAHLPVLLLFVAVLGGLQVYGLLGALMSPLLVAVFLAFARIYREQYPLGG